eukprot:74488-Prymnesium_polylepis.1
MGHSVPSCVSGSMGPPAHIGHIHTLSCVEKTVARLARRVRRGRATRHSVGLTPARTHFASEAVF